MLLTVGTSKLTRPSPLSHGLTCSLAVACITVLINVEHVSERVACILLVGSRIFPPKSFKAHALASTRWPSLFHSFLFRSWRRSWNLEAPIFLLQDGFWEPYSQWMGLCTTRNNASGRPSQSNLENLFTDINTVRHTLLALGWAFLVQVEKACV
jgi:hypothetical protein